MRNKPALTAADVQKMAAACKAEAAKNKRVVTIAIGVSGVQSHEDEQVANAGVAALGV